MATIDEIKERAKECMGIDKCLFCSWSRDIWCNRKIFAREALEIIQQLEAAQPKWISVEERLPVVGEVVLVSAKGRTSENTTPHDALTFASYWGDEGWIVDFLDDWNEIIVTHWRPLPEPPQEDV